MIFSVDELISLFVDLQLNLPNSFSLYVHKVNKTSKFKLELKKEKIVRKKLKLRGYENRRKRSRKWL